MPFANSNGCNIYYEMHGDSGSPVLLIAGYGASIVGWYRLLVSELATRHRVVLFDNRGVGQSDKPDEPYSMAQFADDAAAVLDAAGIEAAHVFSTSMGGMIAQNFVLRHPSRVFGLVLGCTVPAGMDCPDVVAPSDGVVETLLEPRGDDPAQDIRNMWPILYSPDFIREHSDWLEDELQASLGYPSPPQFALQCQMHAIKHTHDVRDRLSEIQHPTLVMTGNADVLVPPENSRFIAARIPGATLIEYHGAGHDFVEEDGQAVIDDVVAFFNRVDHES